MFVWEMNKKLEFNVQLLQKLPPGGKLSKIFDF